MVKEAGRVEVEAHGELNRWKVPGCIYRGDLREAREMFNCSINDAVEAVKRAARSTKR
jgi:hypothetical protein